MAGARAGSERAVTLVVYTARVTYAGADRLDVTRKSGGALGVVFAPSWALLRPHLAARREGRDTWDAYAPMYRAEMVASYRAHRAAWDALLAREVATLCCYCTDPARCHRTLLAGFLARLGADARGERDRRAA
jgi:hypothetical protein